MWSEDLDKKLQNAAGSNEPAYNDKAWEKMESLLDKHLPPEKKRRPIILFLFLFLFGGALIYMMWPNKAGSNNDNRTATEKSSNSNPQSTPTSNTPADQPSSIEKEKNSSAEKMTPKDITSTDNPTNDKVETEKNDKQDIRMVSGTSKKVQPKAPTAQLSVATRKTPRKKQTISQQEESVSKNVTEKVKAPISTEVSPDNSNTEDNKLSQSIPAKSDPIAQITTSDAGKDSSLTAKQSQPVASPTDSSEKAADIVESKVSKKPKQRKGNQLAFLFSVGPDISGVGVDNPGKWNLQYGIGLSYPINDRLSVRAGFYAAKKIYNADSADYHAPKYWPSYYPNLKTVDANCMVYEIPISLVYSFKPSGKHNWFASAGVASHIMKRETYGYHFKNAWGQDDFYSHTYKNESSHLFSALSLSGGYQYKFSNRFSLMAEPYVKLPISGIGFGKIRLTSAGLLITAALKPFAK